MPLYTVDSQQCIRCGLCSDLCVAKIIVADENRLPFVAPEKEKLCIRCGQCVAFCPQRCNSLSFQPPEDRYPVDAAFLPPAEEAELFLRSRRSIRRFRQEDVDRETLSRIFETVRYAPTASNRQAVRWIVVETREKTDALEQHIIDFWRSSLEANPQNENAAVMSYILKRWDAGERIIFRGAPQLAVAVVPEKGGMLEDGSIALTYLELAAYALGVGCCWGGFFTHAFRASGELRASLGIAEGEYVAGAQMMGYPALASSKLLPPRKKPDITWL